MNTETETKEQNRVNGTGTKSQAVEVLGCFVFGTVTRR